MNINKIFKNKTTASIFVSALLFTAYAQASSYKILNESLHHKTPPFIKRAIDIEIDKKISDDELKNISFEIYNQDNRFDRTFIHFWLKERHHSDIAWVRATFEKNKLLLSSKSTTYEEIQDSEKKEEKRKIAEQKKALKERAKTIDNRTKIEKKYKNKFIIISKDTKEIEEFLQTYDAHLKNDTAASFDLAEFYYEEGNVIKKDIPRAIQIYKEIISKKPISFIDYNRQIEASYRIARIYYYGNRNGYKQDINKGLEWYYKAAQKEFAFSESGLLKYGKNVISKYDVTMGSGLMMIQQEAKNTQNPEAIRLLKKLAREDNYPAMYELGILYSDNKLPNSTPQKAKYWFKKSAELGYNPSCIRLFFRKCQ